MLRKHTGPRPRAWEAHPRPHHLAPVVVMVTSPLVDHENRLALQPVDKEAEMLLRRWVVPPAVYSKAPATLRNVLTNLFPAENQFYLHPPPINVLWC